MTSLRNMMDDLAKTTMERMVAGDARGIRLREDTITESNLLDLHLRFPGLGVYRYNQNEERTVGADWEWFIGSDWAGWFALRIQAKRADSGQYRQLGHEGHGDDDYQYDTLINSCAKAITGEPKVKYFAHYVFFNGIESWPDGAVWSGCPNGWPIGECSHAKLSDFGCSTAPAELVKEIHGGREIEGRRLSAHMSAHVPWSWLFGRPRASRLGKSARPGPTNPSTHAVLAWHQAQERALGPLRLLNGLAGAIGADDVRPADMDLIRSFWERVGSPGASDADDSVLSPELPSYAEFARRQTRERLPEPGGFDVDAMSQVPSESWLPRRVVVSDLGQFDQ